MKIDEINKSRGILNLHRIDLIKRLEIGLNLKYAEKIDNFLLSMIMYAARYTNPKNHKISNTSVHISLGQLLLLFFSATSFVLLVIKSWKCSKQAKIVFVTYINMYLVLFIYNLNRLHNISIESTKQKILAFAVTERHL